MSGILDTKSRMIDAIITREGRRQLAFGGIRIRFVSFTDGETFYESDINSGSSDGADRIFLEAANLPQDQITFESDESGRLVPYRGSNLDVLDGKVLSGSSDQFLQIVTGSAFIDQAGDLLDSMVDNFNRLTLIRDENTFFDLDKEFIVSPDAYGFIIGNSKPLKSTEVKEASIDKAENLFQDKHLSRTPNFLHLPPINKPNITHPDGTPLGNYPLLGQRSAPMEFSDISMMLQNRDFVDVDFHETTLLSNVIGQFFEIRQDQLAKLHVIDYGDVTTDDPRSPSQRVFFVGKLFIDGFGAHTFVNVFTLVFR